MNDIAILSYDSSVMKLYVDMNKTHKKQKNQKTKHYAIFSHVQVERQNKYLNVV
jgi:hypothetical protein